MAATSDAKKSRPAPAGMPIEAYDRLSVKAILPQLATLSGPELKAVTAHEKSGKNRVTLLRAVRQVELAREAASKRPAPATSHLTIVETAPEPPDELDIDERDIDEIEIDEIEIDEIEIDEIEIAEIEIDDEADELFAADDDDEYESEAEFQADDELQADDDFQADEWQVDDYLDDFGGPAVSVPEPEAVPEPPVRKSRRNGTIGGTVRPASVGKTRPEAKTKAESAPAPELTTRKARTKAAAKHATWEEEVRPQLPKRIESMAYELDPPIVALVPDDVEGDRLTPTATPGQAPRTSGTAKVARKFEGAALVMAAILAILLGLAIGTVLARGGSTSASGAPPVAAEVVVTPNG